MKITLLSLHIRNFKGIRDLKIDFSDRTIISGDNGTGKTSVVDAFLWLLFGKNSSDEKDFNIKTLDQYNQPIHKLEHEVIAVIDVDGLHSRFSRMFKEKWTKKRGSEEAEFTDHKTFFTFNEVPISAGDFKAKIDAIISEELFKMITSPIHFNRMKRQDRRAILSKMAGDITDESIAGDSEDFKSLLREITGLSFVEFRKQIAAKRKKIKDEIILIPAKIDEVKRNIVLDLDYANIEWQIGIAKETIVKIDSQIDDGQKAMQDEIKLVQDKQREKHTLESKLRDEKYKSESSKKERLNTISRTIQDLLAESKKFENEIEHTTRTIQSNKQKISELDEENNKLRNDAAKIQAETFVMNPSDTCCPTCKRELENAEQKTKELSENFYNNQNARIGEIIKKGTANKSRIESLESDIKRDEETISLTKSKISTIAESIKTYDKNLDEINAEVPEKSQAEIELEQQIASFIIPDLKQPDNSKLKAQKSELEQTIRKLELDLSIRETNRRTNDRISELEKQEREMAKEMALLERKEFLAADFQKKKISEIERRINDKFSYVRWKMFEQQLNGGEVEFCECVVNGVPFSDLNTASKINAGIDIINAICKHYEVSAPIFIDNRESVNEILPCESQIINLKVSNEKRLTILNQ